MANKSTIKRKLRRLRAKGNNIISNGKAVYDSQGNLSCYLIETDSTITEDYRNSTEYIEHFQRLEYIRSVRNTWFSNCELCHWVHCRNNVYYQCEVTSNSEFKGVIKWQENKFN